MERLGCRDRPQPQLPDYNFSVKQIPIWQPMERLGRLDRLQANRSENFHSIGRVSPVPNFKWSHGCKKKSQRSQNSFFKCAKSDFRAQLVASRTTWRYSLQMKYVNIIRKFSILCVAWISLEKVEIKIK
jgi:hypothetical protein